MAELLAVPRLALYVTQVMFRDLPRALQDPYALVAKEFDATVDAVSSQLGYVSQLQMPDEHMVLQIHADRAVVRVEDPEDPEIAIAKTLAAWEKLQGRLELTDIRQFSARAVFIEEQPGVELSDLVARWRERLPKIELPDEPSNAALVFTVPFGENGRRRIFFSPARAGHLAETFTLSVPEEVFYYADIDHLFGRNMTFSGTVSKAGLHAAMRDGRDYAEALFRFAEGDGRAREESGDGS